MTPNTRWNTPTWAPPPGKAGCWPCAPACRADPVPSAWLDAMTYNLSLLEELSGAKGGDGA